MIAFASLTAVGMGAELILDAMTAAGASFPAQMFNPYGTPSRDWVAHKSTGLDFSSFSYGTAVRAPHAGVVSTSWNSEVGNIQYVRDAGGYSSTFFHLKGFHVTSGSVAMGDYISWSGGKKDPTLPGETALQLLGESGSLSTGPHLHWHLQLGSARFDPLLYVNHTGPGGVAVPPPIQQTQGADDGLSKPIYYMATSGYTQGGMTIAVNDIWVRTAPGEPLRFCTNGQAAEFWAPEGISWSTPDRLKGREGSWFFGAFAEDTVARNKNAQAATF